MVVGRDLVVPVLAAGALAFALIPAGRLVAWFGLLVLVAGLGRVLGRAAGITAAVTAGLLHLIVHGQPRFATTITDPWTIRLGFLLGILGVLAAALAGRQPARSRRHRHECAPGY
jgi:hypothetical protein